MNTIFNGLDKMAVLQLKTGLTREAIMQLIDIASQSNSSSVKRRLTMFEWEYRLYSNGEIKTSAIAVWALNCLFRALTLE